MEITLKQDKINLLNFVKLGAIGFICSFGILFSAFSLLMLIVAIVTFELSSIPAAIGMLVMAPIVTGLQGAIFGAIAFLGLRVFSRFKAIATLL